MQAHNYVFPSLINNTHIVGPMNEIILAFDHLLIELTLVGLRVKVLKCKLWSPLGIFSSINIPQGCTLVTNGLRILGMLVDFKTLSCIFWMKLHFKMWHISMTFFFWETPKFLWAFCPHVWLVNLLIPFGQYHLLLPSCFFWRVLIGKLCMHVGTLWV